MKPLIVVDEVAEIGTPQWAWLKLRAELRQTFLSGSWSFGKWHKKAKKRGKKP